MAEELFELNLLDNGLDFIIRGIHELYELDDSGYPYISPVAEPQKDYKYGILHLFSGFLLLLKERLSQHGEELIFVGRMEEIRKKLKSGNELNTVNLDEALDRLEIGPRVKFSDADIKVIKTIQSYRNRFEHYKFDAKKLEITEPIIKFIDLIDRFLINELKIDITSTSINTNPEIKAKILSIESIYKRIVDERERKLNALGEEKLKKFKKNRKNILQKLDEEKTKYEQENHADITLTIECPMCVCNTLIIYGEFSGVCFNKECYSYFPLKSCDRCGEVTTGYELEEKWCDNCWDEIQLMAERDD